MIVHGDRYLKDTRNLEVTWGTGTKKVERRVWKLLWNFFQY